MQKIFFSYAREDSEFALKLASDLRSAGQEVWLDQLDIPAGARWDRSVEKALAECPNVLVVLSPSSAASPNVMDEVSFAIDEGKRLIPILREACDVPFRLRRFQYIDFTTDYDRALAFTLKDLVRRSSMPLPVPEKADPHPATPGEAPSASPPPSASAGAPTPAVPVATRPASHPASAPAGRPPHAQGPPRRPQPQRGSRAWRWLFGAIAVAAVAAGVMFATGRLSFGNGGGGDDPPPPPAQPVARFTANPVSGPSPLLVAFSSQSAGEVDELLWEFGDGSSSSDPNPTHTYEEARSYTVKLTVSGPGGRDTISMAGLINVGRETPPPPEAAFRATPARGAAPLSVAFSMSASGSVTQYAWDFGDGGTSVEPNPTHEFRRPGTYEVRLAVTGPGGSDEVTETISVTEAPVAVAAAFTANPTTGQAPLTVAFRDQSTGPVRGYQWDFGDGGASAEQNPRHRYTAAGTYTVRLTVTGSGSRDAVTKSGLVTVAAAPPPASCFWLSSSTNNWQAMNLAKQQCYEADSCSGGLGRSGGGCYKWSAGPGGAHEGWDDVAPPSPPEAYRCMDGAWNETSLEGPGAPFTWTMSLRGNALSVKRDDGTVEGTFTWTGREFRGPLRWYTGDVWDDVVVAAPTLACTYVDTNQGWKYVRYRSRNSDTAVEISFRNMTAAPVEVFWINYEGQEQKFADLPPGQTYTQGTYATHPWRFKQAGRIIGYYTGTTAPVQTFDIR